MTTADETGRLTQAFNYAVAGPDFDWAPRPAVRLRGKREELRLWAPLRAEHSRAGELDDAVPAGPAS